MVLTEAKQNLFAVGDDFAIAYCISSDYIIDSNVSVEFTELGVTDILKQCYAAYHWNGHGYCLPAKTKRRLVYNLVIKNMHDEKPTYTALKESFEDLRDFLIKHNTYKLAMPAIGYNTNEFDYARVYEIIREVFGNTGVELKICKL